ncbi:MAG: DNA-directed RNA polymerase subunit omega [Candidatus Zixiibacteriota bacterium]
MLKKPTRIFSFEEFGVNKYEAVLLAARRARQINAIRINLQKRYQMPLIEKDKPTNFALQEILEERLTFEYNRKPNEKEEIREIKKF